MKNSYFEQSDLWGNNSDLYQVQVRADILDLLPADVESVLDVGCGDGFITNALPEQFRVTGLDSSLAALRYVRRPKGMGMLPNLPLPDCSFDLIMINDVLEHIPDEDLDRTLNELRRVARKYILITVPFDEDIQAHTARCADCGTVYHLNHHQRIFNLERMQTLLAGRATLLEIRLSGGFSRPPHDTTLPTRHKAGLFKEWDQAVCPRCGSKHQEHPKLGPYTKRLLDSARSMRWARRLRARGPWSTRTEVIGLYSCDKKPILSSPQPQPLVSIKSCLEVDFSNPLQQAPLDFVPGMPWAQFIPPPSGRITQDGLEVTPEKPNPSFVRVMLPVEAQVGDSVLLDACGLGRKAKVRLYGLDGGVNREIELGILTVPDDWSEIKFTFDRTWLPDQFGLILHVYLDNPLALRRLTYLPGDPAVQHNAQFVTLQSGHTVIDLKRLGDYVVSWGVLTENIGRLPCNELARMDVEAEDIEVDISINEILTLAECQCDQSDNAYQSISKVLEAAERNRSKAENKYVQLHREYNVLAKANQSLNELLDTTERNRLAAENQYAVVQQQYNDLAKAHQSLNELLETTERNRLAAENQSAVVQQQYNDLAKAHQSLNETLETIERNRSAAENQYALVQQQYNVLAEANRNLNELLETSEKNRTAVENQYAKLQQEYNQLEANYKTVRQDLELRMGLKGG